MSYIEIPGGVDPHVHLREPGGEHKEGFRTGTRAAAAGGITTVFDMPNNPYPIDSVGRLLKKMGLARSKAAVDTGFHYIGTVNSITDMEAVAPLAMGLKIYMNETTGGFIEDDEHKLERIFAGWKSKQPIIVHAEGEKLTQAIALAHNTKQRLHVAHVSLAEEVAMIQKAKEMGIPITAEVTPHHLFLTDVDAKALGSYGEMKPPLGTANDVGALWRGIRSKVIDIVATDHAPHTKEEKDGPNPPSGVTGLETTLPLLVDAMTQGRLDLEDLVRITSRRATEIFNIPYQDSLVRIDLDHRTEIKGATMQTKCGWTPFEGLQVVGRIAEVQLRGQVIFDGEKVIDTTQGRIIKPVNSGN